MNLFKTVCATSMLIFFRSHAGETQIQEGLSLKQKSNSALYEATITFTARTSLCMVTKQKIFDIDLTTIQYPSGTNKIAYFMHIKEIPEWGINRKWIYHHSMKYPSKTFSALFLRQHPLTLRDQALCFIVDSFDRQDPLLEGLPGNLRTIIQEITG